MLNKQINFERMLKNRIIKLYRNEEISNIIFLCIGTNKIIGDAIGPIVGSKIKHLENSYIKIYGTEENNLNFNNAKTTIQNIYNNYKKTCIITIDAALSDNANSGDIFFSSGFIKIGKALEKTLCFYSDINIKYVVGESLFNKKKNLEVLKNVAKEKVSKDALFISKGIENVMLQFEGLR